MVNLISLFLLPIVPLRVQVICERNLKFKLTSDSKLKRPDHNNRVKLLQLRTMEKFSVYQSRNLCIPLKVSLKRFAGLYALLCLISVCCRDFFLLARFPFFAYSKHNYAVFKVRCFY